MVDIIKDLQKFDYIFYGFLCVLFINALQEWYFDKYIFPFYTYLTLFLVVGFFTTFGFYFYLVSFFFSAMFRDQDVAFLSINFTTAYLIVSLVILVVLISKKATHKLNINNRLMFVWSLFLLTNIFTHSIPIKRNWVVICMFESILIYFIMVYFINNRERLKKSVWFIMLILSFFGIRMFRDFIFGGSVYQKGLFGWENNYFAMILLSGVALAYFLFISSRKKTHKLLSLFSFVALIAGVVMGGSRGAFLGLFVVGIYILFKSVSSKTFKYLMLLSVVFLIVNSLLPQDVRERYLTLENVTTSFQEKGEDVDEGSMRERIQLFWAGLDMFKDNFLIGVGITNFRTEIPKYIDVPAGKASHSMYVQMLAELGIFGGLIFFGILFSSFYNAYTASIIFKKKREKEYYYISLAALGGLVGFCSAAFFLNPQGMSIFWMFIGLATVCKTVALGND